MEIKFYLKCKILERLKRSIKWKINIEIGMIVRKMIVVTLQYSKRYNFLMILDGLSVTKSKQIKYDSLTFFE